MSNGLLAVVTVLAAFTSAVQADEVYTLIQRGDLERARQALSELSTASLRDGNRLFYLSLLETDGEKAVQLMQAALNASVAPQFREEIYHRLAQYYAIERKTPDLTGVVAEYLALWEAGNFRGDMLRLSALVDEMGGAYESAIHQTDRYLLEFSEGEAAQWGMVDKARIMLAHKKRVGADKLLRQLSRQRSGPGVPLALYLLASEAIKRKRADDAVFYYNLLREEFPAAVGLDALADRIITVPVGDHDDAAAERLTGTYYSVQVGVFSKADNAKRQARAFSIYGRDVDIEKKVISGREYRVVYVGRFDTYPDALAFKKMLEVKHNEVFQVVAR